MCYTNLSYENMDMVFNGLKENNIKASFSVTKQDILTKTDLVKQLYFSENGFFITANASGQTPEEYAESYIAGLEEANKALKLVMKKKVRMCTLPLDLPKEVSDSEQFKTAVKNAGYTVFYPNVQTEDGPEYTGSAFTISSNIKNGITDGFDKNHTAIITALLWCSEITEHYTLDLALFVNKYKQFEFCTMNEAFLQNG